MSTKIKALNEEELSFEDDPDNNGKPSKEAQEELSILKYNKALKTLKEGRKQEAVDLLEEIVSGDDLKQLSPPQQKLQLGCLKVLGDLYRDGECKNLERCKIMYEKAIYYDQAENNINFWYRLGKVCFEMGDLYSAHMAFGHALQLRPGHWSCLEHMVTISYAIQDYAGCLNYCTTGLALDSGFFKGQVFRDLVYKVFPEFKSQDKELVTLSLPAEYQETWKEKYLDELKRLQDRSKGRILSIQREIRIPTPKLQFNLKSLSLVDVVKEVLLAYEKSFGTPEFHKVVEINWMLQDGTIETDEVSKPATTEESQTEEESQSQIRSRSSSDDKDNHNNATDSASQQETDAGDKTTIENSSECQPLDAQNTDTEAVNKKKKRDVKWWQIEGKRRSQRVRGHLMPVSPDKTKKESSFADQLKNLIPAPLLGDDGSMSERESAKTSEKSSWQKKLQPNYFGTREEECHVKQLLVQLSGNNLACIMSTLVEFLTSKIKCPWPSDLRELYLYLYQKFRSYVSYPNINIYDFSQVVKDAFACINFVEIVIEKYKTELSLGDKDFCKLAEKEIFFLEECILSPEPMPIDLILRVKWATVRRLLQMSLASNDDEVNSVVCSILSEMETELRHEPTTIWTVNEISNLICLESVSEKAVGITKMQNSQVVTDLYQSQQYESLVGVLQSCINFSEIEKRDLSDILYFTVALYRTDNCDCIHHCLNLINQAIRFQDNTSLSESLVLLEEIWKKMNSRFSLQDKRSIVGSLLKILVACERKPPSQESILSVPWCLLHSVMFSLEREEPAFYLEEETVPNSVLLLQMAHECMSRTEKCCVDNGKLMLYTMKEILKVKKLGEYFLYEETRLCMEQAIFCLYAHPSKKSKVKNLKDHNSVGTTLSWNMCPTLYQYYYPDTLPEFDSFGSITTEVESLFQRFLEIMPKELNPVDRQKQIQTAISISEPMDDLPTYKSFPEDLKDIFYLIGDYYFKNKEWSKAVTYYTWDLAVNSSRFDSWAAIALCLGESINTTLNTADVIEFKDLLNEAQSTAYCFRNALKIEPSNIKLRIEFGSFVYAMHAYCSRLMKQQQATDIDMDRFILIEKAKDDFLKSSFNCFELIAKNPGRATDSLEIVEEELWIHHYMLGKINEKMKEDSDEFLKQYELAGKLLHDQGAPYPSKMNYYSPPELAIEALEIYYRVHASILSLVETVEHSVTTEKFYLQFIRRQENGPFVRCKQSKGEGGESKRGRKAAEDAISKKDMVEITSLLNDLVDQAAKLAEAVPTKSTTTSSATSTTTTEDETSTDSVPSVKLSNPAVHSYSLAEFRKRLQEKEERQVKIATEAKKVDEPLTSPPPPPTPAKEEDIYEGLQLDSNHFYSDFKEHKYGAVIALCLKAMEECILRYPSHFKSYYRLAHSYLYFLNDAKRAREYLMGSPHLSQRKIAGLFGERKPTNFFNGIWRNPIDDVDRPGSFSYHMNKSMQLLLNVLSKLNDHQLLADIGIYLTRVPDNEKKYLSNPDREMFCQQAWNSSIAAVKKKTVEPASNVNELGIELFDTYAKFQKHNPRGHPLGTCLHDVYRILLTSQGVSTENVTVDHALRYFSTQHMLMKQSTNRGNTKASAFGQTTGDPLKPGADGAPPRKRGRRNLRQTSQEAAAANAANSSLPTSQDLDAYGAFAAAFQSGILDLHKNSTPLLPLSYLTGIPGSNVSTYPTMNIDPTQAVLNPLINMKHIEGPNKGSQTPPPAHESGKGTKSISNAQSINSSGFVPSKLPMLMPPEYTPDTERNTPNVPEQTRSSKQAVRKNSKQEQGKESNKYPPPPPLHSIRINTSPYKAQSTAVEQPPQFSYNKKSGQGSSSNQSNERKNPPVAHSHTTPKRTQTEKINDEEEDVEIIDLTVKTPEKDSQSKERLSDQQGANSRNVARASLSLSNPKPKFVDLRAMGITPRPSTTNVKPLNVNPRHVVINPKHNARNQNYNAPNQVPNVRNPIPCNTAVATKKSISNAQSATVVKHPISNVQNTTVIKHPGSNVQGATVLKLPISNVPSASIASVTNIVKHPKQSVSNPRPSTSNNRADVANTKSNVPNAAHSLSNSKPNVAHPKQPGTSVQRPPPIIRAADRLSAQGTPYPLPPKKKHQQLMYTMPPAETNNDDHNDDDDVEVICLD